MNKKIIFVILLILNVICICGFSNIFAVDEKEEKSTNSTTSTVTSDDKSSTNGKLKEENKGDLISDNTYNNKNTKSEGIPTVKPEITNNTLENIESNSNKTSTKNVKEELENLDVDEGVYIIKSALNNSKVIDISTGSKANKANVQIWNMDKVDQQKFLIKKLKDGYYSIKSVNSDKVLDVDGAGKKDGTNVWQYEENNTDAQKWTIKTNGDGFCSFISKCNGLFLNVASENVNNGTNVNVTKKKEDSKSQKFILTKAEEFNGTKTLNNGIYTIKSSLNEEKVLDVSTASTKSGANIQLWGDENVAQQRFIIKYIGSGFYIIENFKSGKVLDVAGASTRNETNVWQYEPNSTNAQKWVIKDLGDGFYNIISRCGGLYLETAGEKINNGTNIQVSENKDESSQKFKIVQSEIGGTQTIANGTYQIATVLNEAKVLDVSEASMKAGANIQLWSNENVSQQKFIITYLDNGLYTVVSEKSNKAMDVKGAETRNGTNVWQYDINKTFAQQWVIKEVGDGCYSFISRCNDLYLNVAGNANNNGTNIQVYQKNSSQAQKFKLVKCNPKGIDVSAYQGNIDWQAVKKAGVEFAMIRVGYRGYETGRIVQDSKYKTNIANASKNKINCGIYFVTQAVNYNEGVEEARWVINAISGDKSNIKCPITIDVEWAGGSSGNNGRADSISVPDRTQAIKGFCETIKAEGYIPMIYANKDWLTNHIDMSKLSSYKVWLAHYVSGAPTKKSNYKGDYEYWQYTSTGNILRNKWLCGFKY